jgi:succinate dehydrogenase hydrophobic anchor subunit
MSYTYQGLMAAVENLVNFLIRMASLAVVVVIVWYGLQMVLAKGDAAKYGNARKGFNSALIGALVIFGVWTIIATIQYFAQSLGGQ